mgnify:CR=1 FL=1
MSKLDELIRELCPDGVEYKKLGEIATVLRGASPRPIKKYITNDSDGVNWIKIGDVPVGSKYITQSEEKITKEGAEKSRYVRKGDFILSNSMSFGRPYILAIDGCIHDGWLSISNFKDVFLSDYLYYLLSSSAIQQEMKKRASFGGAVQNLNADIVKALVLPVPPIEVQNEIVRILDDYTENVVELQNQLALEITARQRQYTFYRNKLLTYDSKTRIMPLKDVAEIERGTRVVRSQLTEAGLYPVFQNALTPMGYYDKANRLENNTFLICAGAAGQIGYSDVDFWAADDCYTFKCCEKLENRYLFHVLKNSQHRIDAQVRRASIPRISREAVGNIRIPIPPLDVQNRIVNVLDNFEKICSDLNIGLPAEIEARQKQYEYYRDKLLTFAENGNTILSRAEQSRALIKLVQYVYGCVWLELGDVIVSLNTGLNPRKFFKLNTEDATNYYITIREMKDGKIVPSEKTDRMNDEARKLCNNRSNLEVGDVLFSGTGTIGETAVIEKEPSNWNIKEGVYAIKPNQTMIKPMYLRYILMTDFIKKEYMKKAAGGTVQSVPMGELKKIRIPVPSLQEQNRIVGVLKQLDDLCNDLTSGLPAEIEARQKQYEYYRDKLLTFKERG